jgi:hypothetical protein
VFKHCWEIQYTFSQERRFLWHFFYCAPLISLLTLSYCYLESSEGLVSSSAMLQQLRSIESVCSVEVAKPQCDGARRQSAGVSLHNHWVGTPSLAQEPSQHLATSQTQNQRPRQASTPSENCKQVEQNKIK